MAPAKRTAAAAPSKPSKVPKVAAVEVDDNHKAILEILQNLSELQPSCVDTLKAAVPYVIGVMKADRHRFQEDMVNHLTGVVEEGKKFREKSISEAEDKIAAHIKGQETAAERLVTASQDDDAKLESKTKAEQTLSDLELALKVSESSLRENKENTVKIGQAITLATQVKDSFQGEFSEVWPAVFASEFTHWRERQKMIGRVSLLLQTAKSPVSLQAATPVALKDKPEARSEFGNLAVSHAESFLKQHIEDAVKHIEQLKVDLQNQESVVQSNSDEVASAKDKVAGAKEGLAAASKSWSEAHDLKLGIQQEIENAESNKKSLDMDLLARQELLKTYVELVRQFEEVRDATPEPLKEDQPMEQAVPKETALADECKTASEVPVAEVPVQ